MTGFTHHFYPEMREAKRLVNAGMISKPLSLLDSMSISYSFVMPWHRDKEMPGAASSCATPSTASTGPVGCWISESLLWLP